LLEIARAAVWVQVSREVWLEEALLELIWVERVEVVKVGLVLLQKAAQVSRLQELSVLMEAASRLERL
jgi:hypothetical protein